MEHVISGIGGPRAFLPERPTRSQGGTDGSNPLTSSGESGANPKSLDQAALISGGSQVKLSGDGTLPAASLVDLLVARSALTFGADESARLGLGILGRIDRPMDLRCVSACKFHPGRGVIGVQL